ncbi:excisionase [Nocardia nova]|nr:excisionase [Nocardia nova]
MRAARVFAVLVIVGVGAAAFRLSFATLRDLATLAHIPASDAWLFPLIIDGTIVQATAGALVLAKSPERKFFTRVLGVGALVSVAGNSIHAIANGHLLPAWLCAIVAAIAPVSLLVDTHGLAVLFRAAKNAPAAEEHPEPAPVDEQLTEPVAVQGVSAPVEEVPAPRPVPVVAPAPVRPVRPVVRPVHPVRPVQQEMLPFAVPAGS